MYVLKNYCFASLSFSESEKERNVLVLCAPSPEFLCFDLLWALSNSGFAIFASQKHSTRCDGFVVKVRASFVNVELKDGVDFSNCAMRRYGERRGCGCGPPPNVGRPVKKRKLDSSASMSHASRSDQAKRRLQLAREEKRRREEQEGNQ